ncbi:MAG: hypothetical protein ACRC6E_02245 [Fusobacteriaceae bacterium]
MITLLEASKLTELSVSTIKNWAYNGSISYEKRKRIIYVAKIELLNEVQRRKKSIIRFKLAKLEYDNKSDPLKIIGTRCYKIIRMIKKGFNKEEIMNSIRFYNHEKGYAKKYIDRLMKRGF